MDTATKSFECRAGLVAANGSGESGVWVESPRTHRRVFIRRSRFAELPNRIAGRITQRVALGRLRVELTLDELKALAALGELAPTPHASTSRPVLHVAACPPAPHGDVRYWGRPRGGKRRRYITLPASRDTFISGTPAPVIEPVAAKEPFVPAVSTGTESAVPEAPASAKPLPASELPAALSPPAAGMETTAQITQSTARTAPSGRTTPIHFILSRQYGPGQSVICGLLLALSEEGAIAEAIELFGEGSYTATPKIMPGSIDDDCRRCSRCSCLLVATDRDTCWTCLDLERGDDSFRYQD